MVMTSTSTTSTAASTKIANIMQSFIPTTSSLRTCLATFPLAVLVYDTFFSLYKVKGSSMEPTLYNGDIVVVRKSDGIWQRWTRHWPHHQQQNDTTVAATTGDHEWAIERGRVLAYERDNCRSSAFTGWIRTPPVPVTGNIVVYKDPETYPPKWNIKRVIGLGGQVVRTTIKTENTATTSSKR
jgi:signal peptidase I